MMFGMKNALDADISLCRVLTIYFYIHNKLEHITGNYAISVSFKSKSVNSMETWCNTKNYINFILLGVK